jgi:hypothetical protein
MLPVTGLEGIENLDARVAPAAQGPVENVVVGLGCTIAVEVALVGDLPGDVRGVDVVAQHSGLQTFF